MRVSLKLLRLAWPQAEPYFREKLVLLFEVINQTLEGKQLMGVSLNPIIGFRWQLTGSCVGFIFELQMQCNWFLQQLPRLLTIINVVSMPARDRTLDLMVSRQWWNALRCRGGQCCAVCRTPLLFNTLFSAPHVSYTSFIVYHIPFTSSIRCHFPDKTNVNIVNIRLTLTVNHLN